MTEKKASAKYAKALFSCGTNDEEKLMQAHALSELAEEVKTSPSTQEFFQNPFVPIEEKKRTLKLGLRNDSDIILLNFLELLIKAKRFQDLPSISFEFQNLINESKKTSQALIIFATEIDSKTKEFFKEKLEKVFHTKMEILEKIDPAIIGGFILIVSGKIIDLSIKGKLTSLKERFYSQKI